MRIWGFGTLLKGTLEGSGTSVNVLSPTIKIRASKILYQPNIVQG